MASRSTRTGGMFGSMLCSNAKPCSFDLVAIRVERVAHQFGDVGLAKLVLLASGLDAGEIEDVVDQRVSRSLSLRMMR